MLTRRYLSQHSIDKLNSQGIACCEQVRFIQKMCSEEASSRGVTALKPIS
jgi:hypothetical protein